MKCEICHKADAEVVLKRKTKEGIETELYVCKNCSDKLHAAECGARKPSVTKIETPDLKIEAIGPIGENGETPPEIKEFIEATVGLIKNLCEKETDKAVCPVCKRTLEEVKSTRMLGCPSCWNSFRSAIHSEFIKHFYGSEYKGPAPDNLPRTDDRKKLLASLKRELKQAVKKEDFKKASELKKRIEEIENSQGGNA